MENLQIKQLLLHRISSNYNLLPEVEAVVMAGSQTSESSDAQSDIDLYVYVTSPIPIAEREKIATENADRFEINNQFWEDGDEWIEVDSNIKVDVMFRHLIWIEEQLDRVLKYHQASVGYSTCFWHNVLNSQILFDRNGWFHQLQQKANQPYPELLKHAIIAKNYPILRDSLSSFLHQLELAVFRNDLVSINHRIAALLASYFDILLAINCLPHPGEKRLITFVETSCEKKPEQLNQQISELICSIGDRENLVQNSERLINGLTKLLQTEDLLPK